MYQMYFDGGTKENKACYVYKLSDSVVPVVKTIPVTKTNNQLEYLALIFLLNHIRKVGINPDKILINGDSELIIKHLKGEYKVSSLNLIDLYEQAKWLIEEIGLPLTCIQWVPRSDNLAGIYLEHGKLK